MKPTDDTRTAEQRGYCKGYAAGKKRKQRDISNEARQRKEDAFWGFPDFPVDGALCGAANDYIKGL